MISINEAEKELIQIEKIIANNLIVEANYCRVNNEVITWDSYESGISKQYYLEEFQTLLNKRQFSFLLKDKSFFQYYYRFDSENNLEEAKLAYYPKPIEISITEDEILELIEKSEDFVQEEAYHLLEFIQDGAVKISNTSHIRIDYNSKIKYDSPKTYHSKCEIQFSGSKNIRIPLNHLISPFIFFDYITRNLFMDIHNSLKTKVAYNTNLDIRRKKIIQNKISIFKAQKNSIISLLGE